VIAGVDGGGAETAAADGATVVFTDGACKGNPGPGGWAWAVPGGQWASGAEAQSTNQRMEVRAALEALRALNGPVEVWSDSTYVVNCFRDRWWEGWRKRGWTNSQKKPVANRDLWEPLIELYLARHPCPQFRWVKGHSGDPMNDLVDRLAVEASATQRARSGDRPPDARSLGPPDVIERRATAAGTGSPADDPAPTTDPRVPPGHKLAVFGHRPPELGGWGPNPVAADVTRRLADILTAKVELHPDLVVLTGLLLGAEQLAAEAAIDAGVAFVAVLAYPEPDRRWSTDTRRRFEELCAGAREVVTLERKEPATRQRAGAALSRRDAWLAQAADEAVLVWDGRDPMLQKVHRLLETHLADDVWLLEP